MLHPVRGSIFLILLLMIALSTSLISISAMHVLSQEKIDGTAKSGETTPTTNATDNTPIGKSVVVNLEAMTIELRDGTSTVSLMPIISKGKPGSYYETPGGIYSFDYKEPKHFSSIGHVFMPWSTHIFGNFFIHGIPYYPDGTLVSSTYSGGCIRLTDENAKQVYEFVEKGTPIIIMGDGGNNFINGPASSKTLSSMDMTRYMTATISLEFLTQDNPISFKGAQTTRRKMLHDLLYLHDDAVSQAFAKYYGKELFIKKMNDKAKSIGLNDTSFEGVDLPTKTTEQDYSLFMKYIEDYKSYLLD